MKRKPCVDNPAESFTQCSMKILPKIFQDNGMNCLMSFWKVLQLYSNMTLCNINQTQANSYREKIWEIESNFYQKPEDYGCLLPCTTHSFNPKLNTFHDKKTNDSSSMMYILVYFSSTTVERKEEYFLYDIMSLGSSLGGNMGLFLGYSLLSMVLSLINFLERCILDAYSARINKVKN